MPSPGQQLSVSIEKPAAGGRMIGRVDGQIILVSGAIPGERVTVRIERVGKGVVYATTTSIDDASVDRRDPQVDLLCGGCLYAHIAYPRQLELKGLVIADAFGRIGRLPLERPPRVRPSPERGYRMRARLHVRRGQVGFFKEGTHELCDARGTHQLLPETEDVLDRVAVGLRSLGCDAVSELEVSENVEASERVVHLESASRLDPRPLNVLARTDGVSGLTIGEAIVGGDPYVTDVLTVDGRAVTLRRHVLAFFQGNRYLLSDLATHVATEVEPGSSVIDLYAGVGLFSMTLAGVRNARVVAVEGDRIASTDLAENGRLIAGDVESVHDAVEAFLGRSRTAPDALVVDPPRTGMSKEAIEGVIRLRARRVIYVSCDVATLARDSRKLVDAGYAIEHIDAFDMFPNTPHVEAVVTLLG